ncbi:MAG TPA: ABC transporter permease [Blastocatellia bacterium]|nr:ABC transporter permease [Blastocatellia bacterium]
MSQSAVQIYDSSRRRSLLVEELFELIRYRDLLVQLIVRNVKTRYKRSVLGIFWTMLNPLLMMTVLAIVFSNIFRIQTKYYAVYVLSGLICWNFFAQTTSAAMSELLWGGSLMNRIYVPRAVFAVSALGTGLVNLVLSMVPLVLIMLVTGVPITVWLLFVPVPMILLSMFALGVGLFLSTLASYFADVLDMFQIILTTWMYLTPIIYPKDVIPEQYRWLFNLNPMYHLLEVFRAPFYAGWLAGYKTVLAAGTVAVVALLFGWSFFTRRADGLPYRI